MLAKLIYALAQRYTIHNVFLLQHFRRVAKLLLELVFTGHTVPVVQVQYQSYYSY